MRGLAVAAGSAGRLPRGHRLEVDFDAPPAGLPGKAGRPRELAEERPARDRAKAHVEDGWRRPLAVVETIAPLGKVAVETANPIFDVFGSRENCDSVKKVRPMATP